jgi:hypothetical protein
MNGYRTSKHIKLVISRYSTGCKDTGNLISCFVFFVFFVVFVAKLSA